MKSLAKILLFLAVACRFVTPAAFAVSGSWDSFSPQSTTVGTGIYVNGWNRDYAHADGTLVANINLDGNFATQSQMTDYRGDIGGNYGWHATLGTGSLSVGSHAIQVWLGNNTYGGWIVFNQAYVNQTGSFTLTAPPPTPPPTGSVSGTSNSITAWGGSYSFSAGSNVSSYYWQVTLPDGGIWTGNSNSASIMWGFGSGPGTYQFRVVMNGPGGTATTNAVTTVVQSPWLIIDAIQNAAPANFTVVSGSNIVGSGWAIDYQNGAPIPVTLYIDGNAVGGTVSNGQSRGDVQSASASYGWSPGNNVTNSGYTFSYNTSALAVGSHTIRLTSANSFAASGNSAYTNSSTTYTFTVIGAQAAVSSVNASGSVGQAFTPTFNGGSGSGAWQFYVAGQTGWQSSAWSPTAPGDYNFYVRKLGDATTAASNEAGPYNLTVRYNQSVVTSANSTITLGQAFTPAYAGGSGGGAYQFAVSGYTNFPGTYGISSGGQGTLLGGSNALSASWTPSAVGTYTFWVRRVGDSSYFDSSPSAAYTVTVLSGQSVASANAACTVGQAFTPSYVNGSGTGSWQFYVQGYTSFPTNGATGTLNGGTVVTSWTPASPGSYAFYVRKLGDASTADSSVVGPYTLTVKANQATVTSANVTLTLGQSFTPSYAGGSGTGNYQFSVQGVTGFPETNGYPNASGTWLPSNTVATSWTPTATGTYTFNVLRAADSTYNYAVSQNYSLTVNSSQPAVSISPTTATVTAGQNVTFTAAGGAGTINYTWGGSASGTGTTKTVTFGTVGTSFVTVYNPANGGYLDSNVAQATITVQAVGQNPVTISPASSAITVGQSVTFTAAGGSGTLNYTWGGAASGNGTSKTVTFNSTGSFSVTVYNPANGNYSQSGAATATITVGSGIQSDSSNQNELNVHLP